MRKAVISVIISLFTLHVGAERWDVRDYVTLPDPLTQSGNTCWAHASAHSVMANWAYLSWLADESYDEYAPDSVLSAEHIVNHRGYKTTVANGGSVDYAIAYYASGQGPKVVNAVDDTVDAKYFVGSVNKLPYSNSNLAVSIPLLKAALKTYGAVSITLNSAELQSPYYDMANHSAYMSVANGASLSANHAGVIVGYDDEFNDFDNLSEKPSSPGAWIVEDSYGTARHNNGFYYLSYYSGTLSEPVAYMSRIDRSEADTIMAKDRLGACGQAPLSNDSVTLFSYYSNPRGVVVKAVGVYTPQINTKVEIGVVKGSNPGNTVWTPLSERDTVLGNPGYHVVPISPVEISAGDSIGLVVQYLTVDKSNLTLALEATNSTGTAVITNVGDQYMFFNKAWYTAKTVLPTANFIMKLYCKNIDGVSAVDEQTTSTANLQAWSVSGDGVLVKTNGKADVAVYDASGRFVAAAEVDGEAVVNVPSHGVYVIVSGAESVKVCK
ncbi:MAG: hypothetical protein J6P49_00235 [Paludibacteraceae bacterium]|nr:hypothetical protein [Paludibacteraceae bacterium]